MKKMFLTALVMFQLATPLAADDALRLSQEDAKQLHAFLLTSELLDFGDRAQSASAYLMAAELMLDYPTGELGRSRILELCQRGRGLAGNDAFLHGWIERLELRAGKKPRDLNSKFLVRVGRLEVGESMEFEGEFDAAWMVGDLLEMQLLDSDGQVLKTGKKLAAPVNSEDSVTCWRVTNVGQSSARYRLLFRKI
jgi:hypothetical protein